MAMLIDTTKCIGCRGCQTACKQWNQLPAENTTFQGSYENPPATTAVTWTRVMFREYEEDNQLKWYFCKKGCMHCTDAACVIVCPSGAAHRTATGSIVIDTRKCIGCNYCVSVCPFRTISFDRKSNVPPKCTFCFDRTSNGKIPACVQACPTGALVYGERNDIVRTAYRRVSKLQEAGEEKATAYGLDEVGGTRMIYVLRDEPAKYGLPPEPAVPALAWVWGALFKPLRTLVFVAVALGLWTNRKEALEMRDAVEAAKEKQIGGEANGQ